MASRPDIIHNKINSQTGENITGTIVTAWRDGTTINVGNESTYLGGLYNKGLVDGVSKYFKWNFAGSYPISRLTTANQANLQKVINDFGSNPGSILIDKNITVSSNLTIPFNIKLVWTSSAIITVNSSITLTINSTITEGDQKLFAGSGDVNLIDKLNINVKWFGVTIDGVTDDGPTINKVIAMVSSQGGGRVFFPGKGVCLSSQIFVKSNMHIEFAETEIKKALDSGLMLRAFEDNTGGDYYGKHENIKITGGRFNGNGKIGGNIQLLFVENLEIDGLKIIDYSPGDWALRIGGRNINIINTDIYNGDSVFEDGIHIMFGDDIRINNCYVESGDDCIALGTSPSPVILAQPLPLTNVTITNIIGKTTHGYIVKIYREALSFWGGSDAWEDVGVSDVHMSNIVGTAGAHRNGAIAILDDIEPAFGSEVLKDITINGIVATIGATTSEDNANKLGIVIRRAANITIQNPRFNFIENPSATNKSKFAWLDRALNVTLFNPISHKMGEDYFMLLTQSRGTKISGGSVKISSATIATNMISLDSSDILVTNGFELTNVPNTKHIFSTSISTDMCVVNIQNGIFAHASGATTGYLITQNGSSISRLILTGNDCSGVSAQKIFYTNLKTVVELIIKDNIGIIQNYDIKYAEMGDVTAVTPTITIKGGTGGTTIQTWLRPGNLSWGVALSNGFFVFLDAIAQIPGLGLFANSSLKRVLAGYDKSGVAPVEGEFAAESVTGGMTNQPGADVRWSTGGGTGTGALKNHRWYTYDLGSSGSTAQTRSEKMRLQGRGALCLGNMSDDLTSLLQIEGNSSLKGVRMSINNTIKVANYLLVNTDYAVRFNATSGNLTANLPTSASSFINNTGQIFLIKKTDASANTVTVDGSGSETIDGAATYVLTAQWQFVMIQSDGAGWTIVGKG